ncbi:unnamed protein product [Nezara viridula]|uniref:Uncharacterized protein n=1 Tax=Nezara viridula TaxID=85310 RepID=A0A9P0HSL1_NEZVI|nr:unnamed protein product [Nezara viridula]
MDWYPREHVRKRGRPPTDWDKEMKKTCGGAAFKRVALERKEWKRMGQWQYYINMIILIGDTQGTEGTRYPSILPSPKANIWS